MADIIQLRRDTPANWTSANPILAQGEFGIELGTFNFKIGDGTTDWINLPYAFLSITELSDLTDVTSATPTLNNVLVGNNTSWVSRPLLESDISDLQTYLTDAPNDGNEYVRLNGAWVIASSASASAWGSITGTLSDQTDLQSALDGKAALSHTHVVADITDFPTIPTSHTQLTDIGTNTHAQIDTHIADSTIHFTQSSISITASQVSDFDIEVSNNSDVTANTAKVSFPGFTDLSTDYGVTLPTATSDLTNDSNFISDAPADGNDYVRNNNSWVSFQDNGIPLSGTVNGSPVTGDIEFGNNNHLSQIFNGVTDYENDDGDGFNSIGFRVYDDNGTEAFVGAINDLNDGANVYMSEYYTNNGNFRRLTPTGFGYYFGSNFNGFSIQQEYISLYSVTPSFRGLEGNQYYGANYTDNTYVQKKYVDDNIPTSTSDLTNDSGFISSTTGDWTGTFDGQEGTYYLDYTNFTNTPTIPSTLSDLSDVNTSTPTNKNVLIADGIDWESRPLLEADISDLGNYSVVGHTHTASDITDFDTEVSNNPFVIANTIKVTNAFHTGDATGDTALTVVGLRGVGLDSTVGTPSDGDILVYRTSGNDWVLEAKPVPGGGGATQLNELSDVNTSTPTNRNVLVADGVDWESRALVEADISDLQSYLTSVAGQDHTTLSNIGTNSHAQIDSHIADSTIHFTQAAISITASQVSDFDTEVSNNSSVVANTAKVSFPGFTDLTTDYSVTLATVATTGSYSDLTGTPTIPNNTDYVDLTTNQTVAGEKIFSEKLTVNAHIELESISIGTSADVPDVGIYNTAGDFYNITNSKDVRFLFGESVSSGLWGGMYWQRANNRLHIGHSGDESDLSTISINDLGDVAIGGGSRNGSEKLDVDGNIIADGYKIPSGTSDDILLGDGTTVSLSTLATESWVTSQGYLTSFTETDPVFTASEAFNITASDITNLGNLSGINTGDQTSIVGITGTKAQFNVALTDGDFLYVGDVTSFPGFTDLPTDYGITLSTVATSGDYNDLSNLPIIPSDHSDLTGIGTNTHAQIDSHIADSSIHFTQASISITESQISDLQSYLLSVDLAYNAASRTITNTGGTNAIIPLFTSTEAGLVPLSGGGTTNFLRADGTWAAPAGGGGSAIEVEDEGVSLTTGVTKFNFVGDAVTVTEPVADEVLVTITSPGSSTLEQSIIFSNSDTTSDLEVGVIDDSFEAPFDFTLTAVQGYVDTAPTGSSLIYTIRVNGSSILSTSIEIEAGENSSTNATTQPVISSASITKGDIIDVEITQIGSTVAGSNLKTTLLYDVTVKGEKGDTGADGLGVPSGGTTGQVLAKASNADNDTEWVNAGGAEVNDLTSAVTWANVPDANITESSVTQHEAALSIADSQITGHKETFIIALSDLATDLTTGTNKSYFRMPYACTITAVRASVLTAPTGSGITVDINESGTTILSTKLTIDATEKTSTTAATPAVISDSSIAADAEITFDIDAVGSTTAGAGLQVQIDVTR